MLELPESITISKQIKQTLTGKTISSVEILHTPHKFAFFHGETDTFREILEGGTITDALARGGMVEIRTEDGMIVLSDGAFPKYYEEKNKFPKKHQFAVYFEDETAVFISIQMYGFIGIYPRGQCEEEYYLSSSKKPSPLSEEFTYDYFRGLYQASGKKMSVKAFLATEQRIPGLGNGVLQDILWDAGIDPRFDMKEMEEADFRTLYASVRRILEEMAHGGGRDTEKDLFGAKGGYITQLSKNSLYEPCMKCGYEIHKASYMGGTIYFCENCQKKQNI